MAVFRSSISVAGAALCAVLLLLCVAPSARADGPVCASKAMYVAAHADDTLLFQSPSLLQDVDSERCVRTVFLTAGDAGRASSYWSKREDGAEAAYAQMAGVANQWTGSQIVANGHSIHLETLKAQPRISIAYLRLPDGGTSGAGFSLYGSQTLTKLWRGGNPGSGSPTISSIEAVDDSTSYGYQDLIDTLAETIEAFEPSQVATQNYTQALVGPDHADHVATAKFVRKAQALYDGPHRLLGFEDYETSGQAQNVFGDLLGGKSFAFYTYGAHDSDACASESHCAETAYAKWLKREYVADTETTGAVAHAGYFQEVASPNTPVSLDGSQSSGESGNPLQYAWLQTDGPVVALSGANTDTPSFTTPAHPTLLTFSLTVKDGSTSSAPDVVKVRVPSSDPTPTAVAGSTQTVGSGATVTLDGSGSWDPNSLPLNYAWLQTAGPAVTLSKSSTEKPTFVAPAGPATLKFSLAVSNGTQTSALSTVTVNVSGMTPTFTSANATTFTTGVTKTFTITTAGSPLAALAKTGSLPAGLAFADKGDGTATIAGTVSAATVPPATSQNFPLTLKATSAAGSAEQAFTLTVTNPGVAPTFTSAAATTFTTGIAKTFTVSTTGTPAAAVAKTLGNLPSGLSFKDNGDGTATISGTVASSEAPPAGTQGYPLTLKATNGAGSIEQAFTLTVSNPGTAPAFTSANATTFTTGVTKTFTIATSGSPVAALAKTGSLPAGLTFTDKGNGTATISGTAAASEAPPAGNQNFPLTLKAASAAGQAEQAFTLTVTNPGTAPAFTSANATTFTTGVAKTFTVTTTGAPAAAIAKTLGSLPSGLAFKDNGDGTATISGTAAASEAPPAGSTPYNLMLKATNGAGNVEQAFTLTVSNPGTIPAFTSSPSANATTGVAANISIATTGAPAAAITKSSGTLPPGIALTDNGNGTAKLSGTPTAAAADPGTSEPYAFTLKASNGAGSVNQAFTLTVTNPGTAPTFTSANATTFTTGIAKTFTLTTTGAPAAAIAKTLGSLPSGLAFKDNGDGTATISGTAAASEAPPAGNQNFPLTLKATSAAGQAEQAFTLTVSNPGTAPAFTSANATTFTTGVAKTFTITTTGAPAAAIAKALGSLPSGLTFTDKGNGTATISGTAAASEAPPAGNQNFPLTLKATNAAGQAEQAFTLTVTNPGTAPAFTSAASTTFTTGVAKTFTFTTTGSPVAAIAKTAGSLPAGLTFSDKGDGTATISGTVSAATVPPATSQGFPLTLKASSAAGQAEQGFTLTVSNPGTAPVFTSAASASATTGIAANISITTTGAPTAAITKLSGSLPPGITFADNGNGTAKLSGTPTATAADPGKSQPYGFTLKADNGVGTAAQQAFTLTVSNPGAPPAFTSVDSTTFTTGVAKSFTVTTSGSPAAALEGTGALPGGLTFTDNGDGTATIAGTAAASAAPAGKSQLYALTLKATNGVGTPAQQTFTLTVANDEEPIVTPRVDDALPVADPPVLHAPVVKPPVTLSTSKVKLLVGRASRHLVKVTAWPPTSVRCQGSLPRGARCRVTPERDLLIEGSRTVRRTGTYRLTVLVADAEGEQAHPLVVQVRHPSDGALRPGSSG